MSTLLARYHLGSIIARYIQPSGSTRCELQIVPASRELDLVEPRATLEGRLEIQGLPSKFKPIQADSPNSLVQLKLREDDTGAGFASGVTLVESGTMATLDYSGQEIGTSDGTTTISTKLSDRAGRFHCIHRLSHREGESGLRSTVEFVNDGPTPLSLELLTSFALNGLTPFCAENSTPHLHFHRFRSWWSLEGRVDSVSLESLHMERSWGGFGTFSERFGQLGTMPVRQWFSTAAVEDRTSGVVWAAQLAWAGSWQMELVRRGDRVTLCGGLADREFGHWIKIVLAGERFITPEAYITVVAGSLDDACHALLDGQRLAAKGVPEIENDLPVSFNEWCTSWGSPTRDNILAIARRLQDSGVRYIVIDDGWAVRPPDAVIQNNGDWLVDEVKFPGGLKPTCDALREMGFIPGIWFEFEVINPGAKVWNETTHMVQRDQRPLQVGTRRFWDFTDPWVHDYLAGKVIRLLRENGIGYLKVDYNDNLGLGCDHPDSLGEGLRAHVEGVQRFFRRIQDEIPDLVIENCSSGGHRLEPSMQALTSMGSFSDAHEPVIIPIIARNLHRLILPQQSLVWAVLRPGDDEARLHFSLAATFLGRVCISGDIHDLADWQMDSMRRSLRLYAECSDIIAHGTSSFHGTKDNSYVDPRGWQAVVRIHGDKALVVVHGFSLEETGVQTIPLPFSKARLIDSQCDSSTLATIQRDQLFVTMPPGCHGGVWLVVKE